MFEFTDMPWYPQLFRRMQTDYLQFVSEFGSAQKSLVPLIIKAMKHVGTTEIVDLCSGAGGPWMHMQEQFKQAGYPVRIRLTDKYPNSETIQMREKRNCVGIDYIPLKIDALNVPSCLEGMRTLFEAFHHFKPEHGRSILGDAIDKKIAIGIFDISLKSPYKSLLIILGPLTTLLSFLVFTPFIKPRTWWRFLWTYIVPVVPLATCWDGVVSLLRVYSVRELWLIIEPLKDRDYTWEVGLASTGTPVFEYTYLIGYPN